MQVTAPTRRLALLLLLAGGLAACGRARPVERGRHAPLAPVELEPLIEAAAREHGLPPSLVRRVVRAESGFNPRARNGPHWGLMQIRHDTARAMGYRGPPEGLLDPATNLRYGTRYLRGAWIVADGDPEAAIAWYRRGYYYEARRRGLLKLTGLAG